MGWDGRSICEMVDMRRIGARRFAVVYIKQPCRFTRSDSNPFQSYLLQVIITFIFSTYCPMTEVDHRVSFSLTDCTPPVNKQTSSFNPSEW